jgi:Tol biopolymer transport system component
MMQKESNADIRRPPFSGGEILDAVGMPFWRRHPSAGLRMGILATAVLISFSALAEVIRVPTTTVGGQHNGASYEPVISSDGRFIVFSSLASNLVPGDTNGVRDIFRYDRDVGTTVRVSVGDLGSQSNGPSVAPAISDDGLRVVFASQAFDLVAAATGGVQSIFLRDLSPDGETTILLSGGEGSASANGASYDPVISSDGRRVAFSSLASNLVAGDVNGREDVFLHDLQSGQTNLVSRSSQNELGDNESLEPTISADGRYVAFSSYATNLVGDDTNFRQDIFLRDTVANLTLRLSLGANGGEGNGDSYAPSISADGRFVAFASEAGNLVEGDDNGVADIFVRNVEAGSTVRVSVASDGLQADGPSSLPALSPDGRYVAFESLATNLVAGDSNNAWDVFVHDLHTGETRRLSASAGGVQGNGHSYTPAIAAYGQALAFESRASNLIANDSNGVQDIFLSYLTPTTTSITSVVPSPSVVGASYRVNVRVSAASGTPGGSVLVSDGSLSCTATLAAGAGACDLSAQSPGLRTLTASYAGGTGYAGSTGSAAHTVNKAATSLSITADTPDPSLQGALVSVTFSLQVAAPGAGTPTGSVTVSDGVAQCVATLPSSGCSLVLNTLGQRTLTATYGGDANFLGAAASAPHQVNAAGDGGGEDADGNGLPDDWERFYNLGSPDSVDPNADPDADGLTHLQEYQAGTHPTRFDTDGDGLGDGAELGLGTDPLNPDTDYDGLLDGWEPTPLVPDINACFGDRVEIASRTYLTGELLSCRAAIGITILPPVVAQPGSTVGLVAPVTQVRGIHIQRGARFRILGQAPVN